MLRLRWLESLLTHEKRLRLALAIARMPRQHSRNSLVDISHFLWVFIASYFANIVFVKPFFCFSDYFALWIMKEYC